MQISFFDNKIDELKKRAATSSKRNERADYILELSNLLGFAKGRIFRQTAGWSTKAVRDVYFRAKSHEKPTKIWFDYLKQIQWKSNTADVHGEKSTTSNQ